MADETSKVSLEMETKGFTTATQALARINSSMDKLDKVLNKLSKNSGMAAINKLTTQINRQQKAIDKLKVTHAASTKSQVAENKKLAASLRAVTKEQERTKKALIRGDTSSYKKITKETANRKIAEQKLKSAIKETNKVQREQLKTMKAEDKVLRESIKGINGRLRALERLNKTQLQYEATIKKLKNEIKALKGEEVEFTSNTDRMNDAIKRANATVIKHKGALNQVLTANKASKQLMAESTVIVKAQQQAIDRLNVAIAQTNNAQDKAILVSKRKLLEDEKLKIQASASLSAQKMQRDAITKLQGSMNKLAGGIRNVGRMLTRYLTPAMLAAVTAGIKMVANIETQLVKFGVLTGSIEKGAKLYREIVEFSAVTPFQLPDLDKAAQILLAFGSPLKSVMNELKMLGDIAMGDSEKLERIVTSFGKVRSRGTAHMRELNRFIMAGVPIFQELRANLGGTGEDLFDMVQKNQITFEHVNAAVVSLTAEGGRFHEMTLKTSRTLEGRFSTALDNLKLDLASIFEIFTDDLKAMLEGFIDWSQGFRLLSDEVRGNIGKMIVGLAALGPALVAIAGGIKLITSTYAALKLAKSATDPIYAILVAIAAIVTVVAVKFGKLKTELDKAGEAAKKVADYTKQMNEADEVAKTNIPLMNEALFTKAKQYNLVALAIERVVQAEVLRDELNKGFKGSAAEKKAKKDFMSNRRDTYLEDIVLDPIMAILNDPYANKEGSLYFINERIAMLKDAGESYRKRAIEVFGEDFAITVAEIDTLPKTLRSFFTRGLEFPTKDEFMTDAETSWREGMIQMIVDLTDWRKLLEAGGVIDTNPLQTFLDAVATSTFASLDDSAFDDGLATASSMINKLLENKRKVETAYAVFGESYSTRREQLKTDAETSVISSGDYFDGVNELNKEAVAAANLYLEAIDNFDTALLISIKSRLVEIEQGPAMKGNILKLLGISDEKDVIKTLESQLDLISAELAGLDFSYDEITGMLIGDIDTPEVVQELINAAEKIQDELDIALAHKRRISLFEAFFEGDIKETEITKIEGDIKDSLDKLSTSMMNNKIVLGENESIMDVLLGHMQAGTLDTFMGTMDSTTQQIYQKVVGLYEQLKELNEEEVAAISQRTLIEALVGSPEDFDAYIKNLQLETLYDELEDKMKSLTSGNENFSILDLASSINMDALGNVGDEINFDAIFAGADTLPLTLNETNVELVAMIDLLREIGVLTPFDEFKKLTETQETLKTFGEGVTAMLESTILPAFETLGESIATNATGLETWSNVFAGISNAIMQALPELMLQAGLSLLGNSKESDDTLGWSLLAGAGILSVMNGMAGADKVTAPTTQATSISYSAKGDAFNKGYITNGPLMRDAGYGISMIGEDGREAVVPLTRSSSGKLGVKGSSGGNVYVNVTNNTSAQVTQEVRENTDGTKSIEFLITETVKKGMATGAYDKTLQRTYGNTRRGR